MENKTKEVSNKITYIQGLRTFAIISVIILHCIADYFADLNLFETKTWWCINIINSVSRFGVPIFFMISGYLMLSSKKEERISIFIKKRYIKILIPFLVWNIFYYIQFININETNFSINELIYKILTMGMSYHFWFVYMLLAMYLFVPIFKCFFKNASRREIIYLFIIVIIPTTIAPFVNKLFGLWIPAINQILEGYFGYFILGYLLGNSNYNKKTISFVYMLGIIGVISSIYGTHYFSTKESIDFFFNGGYQFNSYFIASAIFIFFKSNFNKIKSKNICRLINVTGNLSFGVYLVHVFIINIIKNFINTEKIYSNIIATCILAIIISFSVVLVISKIKHLNKIV